MRTPKFTTRKSTPAAKRETLARKAIRRAKAGAR